MLPTLADTDDLTARGITVPAGMDADTLLASASAAVRDAAGCSISYGTSTVTLVVGAFDEFDLPGGPVASVESVLLDGDDVVGWRKTGPTVALPCGWTDTLPVELTVTYTHGWLVIPADIVDLVCGMVAIATSGTAGYGSELIGSVKMGETTVSYMRPSGADSPSPFTLPDGVRERLRARFGTNVAVLQVR